ncbi:hypothetical protein [Anaerosporobacter mobilis]|jgi:hypothetical protein|uniref:hypothetical protein n=1 Tax=Anaerosporobacter mobilis TaxID=264463 RepID=UPI000934A38A|nr:hypothetical protein [Anaerosporobacter mobilis]
MIIDSGSELTTWEFDFVGNLIQQMQIVDNYWSYRTYKYDFVGYCLSKNAFEGITVLIIINIKRMCKSTFFFDLDFSLT